MREIVLRMDRRELGSWGGEIYLLMKQDFELVRIDEDSEVVYQNYCVDFDKRFLPDL